MLFSAVANAGVRRGKIPEQCHSQNDQQGRASLHLVPLAPDLRARPNDRLASFRPNGPGPNWTVSTRTLQIIGQRCGGEVNAAAGSFFETLQTDGLEIAWNGTILFRRGPLWTFARRA